MPRARTRAHRPRPPGSEDRGAAPSAESPLCRVDSWSRRLFRPVDAAPLVYFRVAFGAIMLWEVVRYFRHGWIRGHYIDPAFFFSYHGFDWVKPWVGVGMYVHFAALGVLAAMIVVGLCYRAAAALFSLGIAYVFLLCQSQYLNHMYLIVLVSFLMIFVPANRERSLDALLAPSARGRWVPAWPLWLLRAQIGLVYVYGGVAKLNSDWLRGEPVRTWLGRRSDDPLIGRWLDGEWGVALISYGGLLFDLLVVPMLAWRRTRAAAVAALVAFHLTNSYLFNIGIFPWFMLAATPLFFPPATLRRLLGGTPSRPPAELPSPPSPRARRTATALLGAYLALQVLIPLRHHLYPGDVSWTEEGHNFSWHMKLRDKAGDVRFVALDPETFAYQVSDPADYLTPRQARKLTTRPDMILQFAHHLADAFRRDGRPDVEIHALTKVSLNRRPPQELVDFDVDLASQPRSLLPAPWIVPLADCPPGSMRVPESWSMPTPEG